GCSGVWPSLWGTQPFSAAVGDSLRGLQPLRPLPWEYRGPGYEHKFPRSRRLQSRNLLRRQSPKFTWRHVQQQGTILHAADFFDMMPNLFKHLANLAVASFDDRNFQPGIIGFA